MRLLWPEWLLGALPALQDRFLLQCQLSAVRPLTTPSSSSCPSSSERLTPLQQVLKSLIASYQSTLQPACSTASLTHSSAPLEKPACLQATLA